MVGMHKQVSEILTDIYSPDSNISDEEEEKRELQNNALELLDILGYESDKIFIDIQFETPKRVAIQTDWSYVTFEAIVAKRVSAPIHLAIKTIITSNNPFKSYSDGLTADWVQNLMEAHSYTAQANFTVLLTNKFIVVSAKSDTAKVSDLSEMTDDEINEIVDALSPPEEFPEGLSGNFPPGYHPDQTKLTRWLFPDSEITPEYRSQISKKHFELNIDVYAEKLYEAYISDSSVDKGDALEDVVEFLFEDLKPIDIRDRNLRTKTGEIDFVLECNNYTDRTLFDSHSRFVLIECKNLRESVPTKEVASFEKKLTKSNISLGILVTWNGISGEASGEYARKYVESDSPDGTSIIVLDSRDLYKILDGASLYELIDGKLYSQRFDL